MDAVPPLSVSIWSLSLCIHIIRVRVDYYSPPFFQTVEFFHVVGGMLRDV
jgi:hypothetical protein